MRGGEVEGRGRGSSGICLRILEKEKKKSMLFLNKNNSCFFFLWLANCLSPFTLSSFSTTNDWAVQKKFTYLVQSEKAATVTTVMSSAKSHLPSGSQSGNLSVITCWVDCKETSCWKNPLVAVCRFQVLPAWEDTEACKPAGHQGWLKYMLQCFPVTAGPSAE